MLGYVGRLTRAKGVHLLIEAFSRLLGRLHLLIVGDGPERERLQSLSRTLGIEDRTRFEPSVPYAAMPQLLNHLDVLVLPSLETARWKELFGRILIEAMATGVPVVASASGGIPEVVGDAGILVETGSVTDLAEKLSYLLGNRAMKEELGMKGRERALRLFDAHVIAELIGNDITNILHAALNSKE